MIYLDSAATSLQKPPEVARAMTAAVGRLASPGRGGHSAAMAAAEEAYACRETAARLFHVPEPEQVVFTMNATHGLNLAIKSIAKAGDRVLISGYEHNSVLRPLVSLGAELLIAQAPPFDRDGILRQFAEHLEHRPRLAVINHVSNVFGFVLPVVEIAALCRERQVPLIVDASQSAGVLDVNLTEWGAAFVAMPGHKGLYGPQGTGLFLCNHEAIPLLEGGSGSDSRSPVMPDYLPERLEAGTHNMPGIAGLHQGLKFVERLTSGRIFRHENRLLRLAVRELSRNPRITVFAAEDPENQIGVLSLNLRDMDCEEAAEKLAKRGFALRAGLHCAPLAHESAGTLERGTLRLSFSIFNRPEQVYRLAEALENL